MKLATSGGRRDTPRRRHTRFSVSMGRQRLQLQVIGAVVGEDLAQLGRGGSVAVDRPGDDHAQERLDLLAHVGEQRPRGRVEPLGVLQQQHRGLPLRCASRIWTSSMRSARRARGPCSDAVRSLSTASTGSTAPSSGARGTAPGTSRSRPRSPAATGRALISSLGFRPKMVAKIGSHAWYGAAPLR